MKTTLLAQIQHAHAWLTRHGRLCGMGTALAMSALFALYNVNAGPLHNLNDIGGWANRALFIALAAAVLFLALGAEALLYRRSFARLVLRQGILTFGMLVLLMGINQKTFVFVEQTLPLVRAMDKAGLSAAAGAQTTLSAPALTLLYMLTRGPIYPMYMLKLACIAGALALSLVALWVADARGLGWRAEALLTLCMILPQAFLSAGCSALLGVASAALLAISLALLARKRAVAAAICWGVSVALSGAALLALPLFVRAYRRGTMRAQHGALALGVVAVSLLPALLAGMPLSEAAGSLLRAPLAAPAYAAGSPSFASFFPRAVMEEMPEYAMLRNVPTLDAVTNAQPFYTRAHYALLLRGITLAGLACYGAVCATVLRKRLNLRGALMLAMGALLACSGADMGVWLAADILCLYALLAAPRLRLPCCLWLFATAGAACYPAVEETLLPPALAMALCASALLMLWGVLPGAPDDDLEVRADG